MADKIEPDKLLADLRLARRALEEGHSGIYRYTAKEKLDRLFDQAQKSLTKPQTALEFYRTLCPVVAAIKCGHTRVLLPSEITQTITTKSLLLPLVVRVLDGKPYVLRDLSGTPATLAGKEIRAINGVSAATIVEKLLAAVPADGDVETSRMLHIGGWEFMLQLEALVGLHNPYDLTIWDPKEKRETKVHLEGMEMPRLKEVARATFPQDQRPQIAGEFKFDDDGKIAVMKIHQFGGFVDAERKKTLKEFYQDSFGAMNNKGTKTLIIDLRDNGGGADELGMLLLSYLLDKPFKYYDDLVVNSLEFSFQEHTNRAKPLSAEQFERQPSGKYRMVKHPNWGIKQPSQPTFRGKLLILINGNSFSTTSEFLSHAHFHKRATFVGEESAGGYYGNASGFTFLLTLPNTKIRIGLPVVTYHMAVSGNKAAAHGIMPDYPIRYSIEELLEGKDKDLALALKLARKSSGTSGN
jgi:C-terminal processing protease CtpA/Prc